MGIVCVRKHKLMQSSTLCTFWVNGISSIIIKITGMPIVNGTVIFYYIFKWFKEFTHKLFFLPVAK